MNLFGNTTLQLNSFNPPIVIRDELDMIEIINGYNMGFESMVYLYLGSQSISLNQTELNSTLFSWYNNNNNDNNNILRNYLYYFNGQQWMRQKISDYDYENTIKTSNIEIREADINENSDEYKYKNGMWEIGYFNDFNNAPNLFITRINANCKNFMNNNPFPNIDCVLMSFSANKNDESPNVQICFGNGQIVFRTKNSSGIWTSWNSGGMTLKDRDENKYIINLEAEQNGELSLIYTPIG